MQLSASFMNPRFSSTTQDVYYGSSMTAWLLINVYQRGYEKGLEIDPNNQQLKEGLTRVREATASVNPMGSLFTPENLMKLQNHPKIREYMQDPSFMQMLTMCGQNPQMMGMMMQDPRMSEVMSVLLGVDLSQMGQQPGAGPPGAAPTGTPTPPPTQPAYTPPPPKPAAPKSAKYKIRTGNSGDQSLTQY